MYKYSSFQIVFSSCTDEFTENQRKALLQQIDGKQRTVACRLVAHMYLRSLFSLLPSEMGLEIISTYAGVYFSKRIFFLMKTSVFL